MDELGGPWVARRTIRRAEVGKSYRDRGGSMADIRSLDAVRGRNQFRLAGVLY